MIHALITAAIAAIAWPFGWHQEATLLVAAFYAGREPRPSIVPLSHSMAAYVLMRNGGADLNQWRGT